MERPTLMLSRRRWGSIGVWDMGLPLASMYAKSHDNCYIPVHSRVFFSSSASFVHQILYGTNTQKSVQFTSTLLIIIATLESSIVPVNLCWDARKKILLCFLFPKDLRDFVVTVVSPKHPRPQDASHADKHAWVARCSKRSQVLAYSASRCLTHSNHSVVHGSPSPVPHNNNN